MDLAAWFQELRRRRVIRALLGWGLLSFAVLQVVEPVQHALGLADWALKLVVAVLAVGFPVTAGLAWAFDLTRRGIERTGPAEGATPTTAARWAGVRPAVALVLVGALIGAGVAWLALRQAGPAVPAVTPSIAVLPFVDLSPGKDQEYFSDGIAEEVLNALAQVEGLKLIGRTSSFSFKGKNEDLRLIGQKLGVGTLLDGSVRKDGGRIRVTAQLVRSADGSNIWSKTFDRDLSGVFAIQEEIARAVVEALRVKLLPAGATARGAITVNREAYDQYLLGRDLLKTDEIVNVKRALQAFEKATLLDGGFAPAWAGVAGAMFVIEAYAGEGTHPERRRRAQDAAERAIALAPGLPDGYAMRSRIRSAFFFDWEGARADVERARELAPGDVYTANVYGRILTDLGRQHDGIAELERATEMDPLSSRAWTWLGRALVSDGEHERARAALARALEISPRGSDARYFLAVDLVAAGRPDLALVEAEQASVPWVRLIGVAIAQHDLGHARESEAALATLVKGNATDGAYQIAEIHAWRGEADLAFAWLERAHAQGDPGLAWIRTDPLLRKVRGDPRYSALLRTMNLPVN